MAADSMTILGLEELNEQMEKLSLYAEATVIKDALKGAAGLVVQTARELAPEDTGQLKRAIKVRAGRQRRGAYSYLASVGKKWFKGDDFYGAFEEFGWHSGKRTSYGKGAKANDKRKPVRGEHFLDYAFEERKEEALQAILSTIKRGLERELGGDNG